MNQLNISSDQHLHANVTESRKVSEIYDSLNVLKYKIILTNYNCNDDGIHTKAYKIKVINYFSNSVPFTVLVKPASDEQPIYNYADALDFYKLCIQKYSNLIAIENSTDQNESLADKINYKTANLSCCMTCNWCKTKYVQKNIKYDTYVSINMLEHMINVKCYNPSNVQQYNKMNNNYAINDYTIEYPVVQLYSICDNYQQLP